MLSQQVLSNAPILPTKEKLIRTLRQNCTNTSKDSILNLWNLALANVTDPNGFIDIERISPKMISDLVATTDGTGAARKRKQDGASSRSKQVAKKSCRTSSNTPRQNEHSENNEDEDGGHLSESKTKTNYAFRRSTRFVEPKQEPEGVSVSEYDEYAGDSMNQTTYEELLKHQELNHLELAVIPYADQPNSTDSKTTFSCQTSSGKRHSFSSPNETHVNSDLYEDNGLGASIEPFGQSLLNSEVDSSTMMYFGTPLTSSPNQQSLLAKSTAASASDTYQFQFSNDDQVFKKLFDPSYSRTNTRNYAASVNSIFHPEIGGVTTPFCDASSFMTSSPRTTATRLSNIQIPSFNKHDCLITQTEKQMTAPTLADTQYESFLTPQKHFSHRPSMLQPRPDTFVSPTNVNVSEHVPLSDFFTTRRVGGERDRSVSLSSSLLDLAEAAEWASESPSKW